jgi:beta-phosphoglucomutase-like phosphatase (HAD superfamily)
VTGDDVTKSKPDPEPYRVTAERLGVHPDRCYAIEDSVNGIKSATAAGCRTIAFTSSFPRETLMKAGASFSIDSFEELERRMFPARPVFHSEAFPAYAYAPSW